MPWLFLQVCIPRPLPPQSTFLHTSPILQFHIEIFLDKTKMRLSNILALLLAPIALAHPIASPDSISISQRDGASSPIQARHQALSARIMKAVDESQELTDMCQKYNGGMSQSFDLYRQFKKCYKSVEHAEHGAKESEPFDESESEKVKEALATLTEKFVQISKYIQDRVSLSSLRLS